MHDEILNRTRKQQLDLCFKEFATSLVLVHFDLSATSL